MNAHLKQFGNIINIQAEVAQTMENLNFLASTQASEMIKMAHVTKISNLTHIIKNVSTIKLYL